MSEDSFDTDAGDVCLDFANTNEWHASDHPIEKLHGYDDLVAWGKSADLVSPKLAAQLSMLALEHPQNAGRSYAAAIQFRESLYRIFSRRYSGLPIREEDLEALNDVVSVAKSYQRLVPYDGKFSWEWKADHDDSDIIVWKIALSAANLLTSDQLSQVRECEDDRGCGYLFLDTSKNHSRRWCSMESCGNRAKARRHYSRSKNV